MNRKVAAFVRKPRRYDLPLHRGSGGKMVMWSVGVMTYLMILTLVLVFGLSAFQHYWQTGLTGRMTVEVPYNGAAPIPQARVDALVVQLNRMPGIKANILSQDEIGELVGPWLGEGAALAELPLPTLINITRADTDNAATDGQLRHTVTQTLPQAVLDTHEEWLAELLKLAKACRMILIAIALVLALTTALTVAATARTRLSLHQDEVDLLHQIGATDSYIATQFQRQAFRLATEGAAAGLGLALATMAIIALLRRQFDSGLLPGVHLTPVEWVVVVATPILAGVIAMGASRVTVLRALRELP